MDGAPAGGGKLSNQGGGRCERSSTDQNSPVREQLQQSGQDGTEELGARASTRRAPAGMASRRLLVAALESIWDRCRQRDKGASWGEWLTGSAAVERAKYAKWLCGHGVVVRVPYLQC